MSYKAMIHLQKEEGDEQPWVMVGVIVSDDMFIDVRYRKSHKEYAKITDSVVRGMQKSAHYGSRHTEMFNVMADGMRNKLNYFTPCMEVDSAVITANVANLSYTLLKSVVETDDLARLLFITNKELHDQRMKLMMSRVKNSKIQRISKLDATQQI